MSYINLDLLITVKKLQIPGTVYRVGLGPLEGHVVKPGTVEHEMPEH